MALRIELPQEQHDRLIALAERLGVRPEEFARAALIDIVNGPDARFKEIVERIIEKNAELYRRLAQ